MTAVLVKDMRLTRRWASGETPTAEETHRLAGWTLLPVRRRLRGQRVKDVDRPANIQSSAEPARTLRMDVETAREVVGPKSTERISGHSGRMWDLGQRSPVRPAELARTVEPTLHAETVLVDRAMMPAAEQREVRQRRRPTLRPVANVVALAAR